jgi:enoyl-[acyl-carrier protein] reductase II
VDWGLIRPFNVPEVLREHIQNVKSNFKPFGVNVPMLYPNIEEIMKIIVDEGVKIVFLSAGTKNMDVILKRITIGHVVSSSTFACKSAKCRS